MLINYFVDSKFFPEKIDIEEAIFVEEEIIEVPKDNLPSISSIDAVYDSLKITKPFVSKNLDEYIPNISSSDDLVKMYIKEIGPIPLLSMKEEYELSKTVKRGLEAKEKLPFTNIEEDYNSLKQKVLESDEARERLVESNLKLVVSVAKKFLNNGLPFQDLIQEGNMGLLKAINKFDPDKGFKFSTY